MVTAGQFGNEEDAGQRSVHHAGHQTCHTDKREIGFRHCEPGHVHQSRGHKTDDSTHEERRREDTSDTAGTVGSHARHDLDKNDSDEIANDDERRIRCHVLLKRAVLDSAEAVAVDKLANDVVTFAVQRREQENQHAQCTATYQQLEPHIADIVLHPLLQLVHAAREIEADETADSTQNKIPRDTLHQERLRSIKREHRLCAREDVRDSRCRHRRDEQRSYGSHRQVHHQHFQRENQTCDGRFEDTADGSGSAATDHQHHRLLVKPESFC